MAKPKREKISLYQYQERFYHVAVSCSTPQMARGNLSIFNLAERNIKP